MDEESLYDEEDESIDVNSIRVEFSKKDKLPPLPVLSSSFLPESTVSKEKGHIKKGIIYALLLEYLYIHGKHCSRWDGGRDVWTDRYAVAIIVF